MVTPSSAARSRSMMAAVVIGTALSAMGARAATVSTPTEETSLVNDLSKYCQACWRNARLPQDRWGDCTQQVFTRLLERVRVDNWGNLLAAEGEDKREFLRAIDAVKKRTQRTKRFGDLSPDVSDGRSRAESATRELWEEVNRAAVEVLSERQQRIVEMSANGWAVPEIASELGTTPERISDEKYKAIRKLRVQLGVDTAD